MILIDMEKPDHCLRCPMRNSDDGCVLIQENDPSWDWEEQYANCPLQEVEPERKNGKWNQIISIPNDIYGRYYCSECGKEGNPFWYFCQNCGADMRGEQDE